ncbi:RHS repeat-associated protein [Treponema pedis]
MSAVSKDDVYGADYGFGLDAPKETEQTNPQDLFAYRRNYTWTYKSKTAMLFLAMYNNFLTQQARKGLNEKNLLTKSSDKNYTVHYRYGEDGKRALKYTEEGRSETLYFNNFFTIHIPIYDKDNPQGLRVHKHIFVGNSRLVTAMTHTDNSGDNEEQKEKRYYYHSDHLGSAQFVTDWKGRQYEHIEYTPYGELWIEEVAAGLDKLPFRFTGKELDEETGLYYYGARYLDPKYSRWLSGDPALNDYIPKAPIDDDAKKHNENLPGMGGVYNTINLHVYHYAGNNPIKYTDPDGRDIHITITNKKVGTGYLRTTDDNGKNIIVKVPTYRMTVYDDATGKTLNYEVTRHSVLDANDSNISEPKDFATYEPKGKSSFFKGFISRKNYGFAIELRNYKNPSLRGDLFRSDTGEANDKTIEIHVGGNYVGLDGVEYNVTSWGCFSLQGEYVNGDGYEKFINDICNKLDYKQNKHIIIEVQKIE